MFDSKKSKKTLHVAQAYKKVFSGEDGAVVLSDLMGKSGFTGYYPTPKQNAAESAFWEGKRAVLLDVLRVLEFDETKIIELLRKEISDGQ